ncbi:MAG TPA: PDZ domain-containing protein [Pirellulales bacterium]|nr:PDZ domain-containing protein [Pirellulales bacterium]
MVRSNRRSSFCHTAALVLTLWVAAPLAADEPQPPVETKPQDSTAPSDLDLSVGTIYELFGADSDPDDVILFTTRGACSNALIGIEAIDAGDVLRSHLRLAEGQGVVVTSVADDSAASKAGVQKNDVLVTVGEQPIIGVEGLQNLLQATADKATTLGLVRSGQKQSVEVTPQSAVQRLEFMRGGKLFSAVSAPSFWLGVGLAGADDTLRSQLGIAAGEGLVVTQVEGESPAAKAGVMVNDLLLKLDGKTLTTIEGLTAQLQEIGGKSAPLELLRRGKPATLTVTSEQRAGQGALVNFEYSPHVLFTRVTNEPLQFHLSSVIDPTAGVLHLSAGLAPDLAKQVADLLVQANQLQKSLEALDAALKAQSPPANPGENK